MRTLVNIEFHSDYRWVLCHTYFVTLPKAQARPTLTANSKDLLREYRRTHPWSGIRALGTAARNRPNAPLSRQPPCKSTRESLENSWRRPRIPKWSVYRATSIGQMIAAHHQYAAPVQSEVRPRELGCELPFEPIRFPAYHPQHPSRLSALSCRHPDQMFAA